MHEKSFEMRHFRVSLYAEEPELAPSWAVGGGWEYNRWWPGIQNGNPGQIVDRAIVIECSRETTIGCNAFGCDSRCLHS